MYRTGTASPKCLDCRRSANAALRQRVEAYVCGYCGGEFTRKPTKGTRPKWCSPACASRGKAQAARVDGECQVCGAALTAGDLYCSPRCSAVTRRRAHPCGRCGEDIGKPGRKLCDPCLTDMQREQISPLRQAVESSDWDSLRECLLVDSSVIGTCWEWRRSIRKGYPSVPVGSSYVGAHRLAAAASARRWLATGEHAHHVCANPRCVNPDHVVPASAAANTAEMKARLAYQARIRQLEDALRTVDPVNPALAAA